MKTITGILMTSALIGQATPASAQGHLQYQIERIADYALTIAADALGEVLQDRRDDRQDRQGRQRGPGARDDRGPEFTEMFTRTVRLGRSGRVELENVSGDVEVVAGSGEDVKIVATKTVRARDEATGRAALKATNIRVMERAGLVTISSEPTRGRSAAVEIDYMLSVPAGTNVSVKTVSGDLTVRHLAGDLQLNSLSGDIVVSDSRPRAIDVDVVSGDVSLEKIDSERIRVNAVSGDITLSGKLVKAGRYELRTHSGDIQVIPDGNPGFDLEAATFSGDVSSDFPLPRTSLRNSFGPDSRGRGRSTDLRGTVNDGGALLSLTSFSGDILITKR